ncbi:hypothetical protein GCM10010353_72370 [Streptomyces chryseus]|nr:hypothetical protein GCM10010353_72370 [Streptomyces chryseus]
MMLGLAAVFVGQGRLGGDEPVTDGGSGVVMGGDGRGHDCPADETVFVFGVLELVVLGNERLGLLSQLLKPGVQACAA